MITGIVCVPLLGRTGIIGALYADQRSRPGLSRSIGDTILRAMEKDPDRRVARAGELAAGLREASIAAAT
jgi:hypothetical protein